MMTPKKIFVCLLVMTVADFLHLPIVCGKIKFSRFCDKYIMKHLFGLKLWLLFKHAELTEVVTQNDKLFTALIKFYLVILTLT